jgi:uncharacterized protein involved in exopolysaccharide biosynthesis
MTPTKNDLSVLDIVLLIFRHKILVIILTFVGATAGILIGIFQQPVYRAETLLSVVEEVDARSSLAGIASQFGGLAGAVSLGVAGGDKNVAIAVLRSRAFLVKFIRDRALEKILFSDRLAPDSETWIGDLGGDPSDNEIFELFSRQIFAVREDNKTGLISVSIEWNDPQIAADWANEIVREVNAQLSARARTRARNSVAFLESEAVRISNRDTQKAIFELIGQQINEIMLTNVTEEYAFEVIDPATASDVDDYVRPRKVYLLASGLITGFLLAMTLVVSRELWNLLRTSARAELEHRGPRKD